VALRGRNILRKKVEIIVSFSPQIEREEDRWFKSIVLVGDKKYSSTEW